MIKYLFALLTPTGEAKKPLVRNCIQIERAQKSFSISHDVELVKCKQ